MTAPIIRIAIVGAGVIGASWATVFLARGMDVVASDPAPGAEDALRKTVDAQWPAMQQIGLSPGASMERLRFVASPEDAVADAGFVQENGPERLDIKRISSAASTRPHHPMRRWPRARRRSRSASSKTHVRATRSASCSAIRSTRRTSFHSSRWAAANIPRWTRSTSVELLSRDGQAPDPSAP